MVRSSVLGIKALIGHQRLVGEDVAVYDTEFLKLASEVGRGGRIALGPALSTAQLEELNPVRLSC